MTAFKQQIQEFNGEEQIQLKQGAGRFNLFAKVSQLWDQYFKDKTQALIDSSGGGSGGITGNGQQDFLPVINTTTGAAITTLKNSAASDTGTIFKIYRKGADLRLQFGLEDASGNNYYSFQSSTNWYGIAISFLLKAYTNYFTGIKTWQDRDLRIGIYDSLYNPIHSLNFDQAGIYLKSVDNINPSELLKVNANGKIVSTPGPYKVYSALISQAGGAAPTVTVLENTLGVVPTFEYQGIGDYLIRTAGVNTFTANKTFMYIANSRVSTTTYINSMTYVDESRMGVNCVDTGDNLLNDGLSNTPFEIRIYN